MNPDPEKIKKIQTSIVDSIMQIEPTPEEAINAIGMVLIRFAKISGITPQECDSFLKHLGIEYQKFCIKFKNADQSGLERTEED